MAEDVVAEVVCVIITHELGKTDLVVDDEQGLGLCLLGCGFLLLWIAIAFDFSGGDELTALSLSSLFHACAGMDAARSKAALIPAEKYILKMGFW